LAGAKAHGLAAEKIKLKDKLYVIHNCGSANHPVAAWLGDRIHVGIVHSPLSGGRTHLGVVQLLFRA
jgi:hypothetical protein